MPVRGNYRTLLCGKVYNPSSFLPRKENLYSAQKYAEEIPGGILDMAAFKKSSEVNIENCYMADVMFASDMNVL